MSGLARHLPNLLTALRIAAAPALALLLVSGADRAALGVFAFAGLSDAADGFLAKRFGLTTRFGRLLDPAADKLLMLVSFATLTLLGIAPIWLTLLVLGRDAAILAGLSLARLFNVPVRVAPLLIGKASTAMQIIYIALALVLLTFGLRWPQIENIAADATAVLTIASWLGYAVVGVRAFARPRRMA
ncbi:MAG TPA: CDP-alcohol phosphatidyltransferase family protein [Rhizomicrobium sp.]|jgi:cardiolipin synthase|nr:CDP-alcohol phosphatidyltransferase family protein [Rhizomicrobium sp.]